MAEPFNLAALLKDVSEPDTGREQIEYISLDLIDSDPNNFYQMTEIDKLADNISFCGLQQPIRVRQQEDGRYMIVSGHRRRAALEMLVTDGYEQFKEVSCIVERDEVSPALQQLRLIYANASTRKLTDAEISEQAVQVEKLLYQLKDEGYDFPGRMRDHVAQAVGKSKTKLARLKVIRDNLSEPWVPSWNRGAIGESVAYTLAQMPKDWQNIIYSNWGIKPGSLCERHATAFQDRFVRISKAKCSDGGPCKNAEQMMRASCRQSHMVYCTGCCLDCPSLQSCKYSCPQAEALKKEKKAVAKKATFDAKREQEERDRPAKEFAKSVWQRIKRAREFNDISIETIVRARGEGYYNAAYDDPKQEKTENGEGDYSPNSTLSFGCSIHTSDMMRVVAVADALHCSVDYLLGRTDRMELVSESDTAPNEPAPDPDEQTPNPILPNAWYPASVEPPSLARVIIVDDTGFAEDAQYLGSFELKGSVTRWDEVTCWCLAPGSEAAVSDTVADPGKPWQVGSPEASGTYIVLVQFAPNLDPTPERLQWTGIRWELYGDPFDFDGAEILGWVPMMDVPKSAEAPLNHSCKTGMSPSGHCGAAAVCGEPHDCCLNCGKSCNLRCGWPDDCMEVM